jgi:Mrp family chromosome partitioning ATPase
MSEVVSVVVGASGAPWELALLHELARCEPGVRVVRRCSEVGELMGVTGRDRPDAVLIDGTSPWLDREVVTALRRSGARVVALGGDPARWAALVRVLPVDATFDTVVRALVEPTGDPVERDEVPRVPDGPSWGRTVAVWSGAGAPGRTTVAIHLAVEAAERGARVLLVDGDTWGASVAQLLDLAEAPSVVQATRAAAEGWPEPLDGFLQTGPHGVSVLTGLPHPDLWTEVTETAWRSVLTEAASAFELVVVDLAVAGEEDEELVLDRLPVRRNLMTTVTLDHADDVVLVAAADPVGLRRAIVAHRRLTESRDPRGDTVRVVLNRVPGPGRRLQECSRAIGEWTGSPPAALLPDEPLLRRSVWEGRPLRALAPRSRWLRELAPVVGTVTA